MSNLILEQLFQFAQTAPQQAAFQGRDPATGETISLSFRQLADEVIRAADTLNQQDVHCLALKADNGLAWAIVDLAAMLAGKVLIPVPVFFSDQQIRHLLTAAQVDALWGDWPVGEHAGSMTIADLPFYRLSSRSQPGQLHRQTCKVTFTSGSTAQPKGVCLSQHHLATTSQALAEALSPKVTPAKHLVMLPLATLLENITGLYVPLLLGATSVILPGDNVGLTGSSAFDPLRFAQALAEHQPESLVLTPALLMALCQIAAQQPALTRSLQFVAVGGARVAPALLAQAHALNIPAYEGYGLSECGSVVSLNLPGTDKPGSCGRPLSHTKINVTAEGDIQVTGNSMLGYLGQEASPSTIHTGDIGYLDDDGFLHITGRRKNQLITGFGRNVSPEWIESEAQAFPSLCGMVVIGDSQLTLSGILFSQSPDSVPQAVQALNQQLPDYARIGNLIITDQPLANIPGLMTANGRPKRDALHHYFIPALLTAQTETRSWHSSPALLSLYTAKIFTDQLALTPYTTKEDTPMSSGFFQTLITETAAARSRMADAPIFTACQQGTIDTATYLAFLTQAYHHVKHTVPLLMACGSRLSEDYEWLRQAIGHYIEEEMGHQAWILNDIAACGGNPAPVRDNQGPGKAGLPIELMVAYLYHQIDRRNPMGLFGMVWVLEGTSVSIGGQIAQRIQQVLGLPDNAMTYLKSHSELDQSHIQTFEGLMNRINDPADQRAIIESANTVYSLYGQMLTSLPIPRLH